MTDKEIRHLGKTELLSILRDQEAELEQLRAQISKLQSELEEQTIQMDKCGSIAEASLQVNQVFQAAQAAADQYLANVREKEAGADEAARRIESEAQKRAEAKIQDTEMRCKQLEAESRKKAAAYWTVLQVQLDQFYRSHEGLKEMLKASGFNVQIPNRNETDTK